MKGWTGGSELFGQDNTINIIFLAGAHFLSGYPNGGRRMVVEWWSVEVIF